jgi:hypothetical protein
MQIDCLDYLVMNLDGRAAPGPRDLLRTFNEGSRNRCAYVASRAGFDATNLALGAHGLMQVIDQMFGVAEPHYTFQDRATHKQIGPLTFADD